MISVPLPAQHNAGVRGSGTCTRKSCMCRCIMHYLVQCTCYAHTRYHTMQIAWYAEYSSQYSQSTVLVPVPRLKNCCLFLICHTPYLYTSCTSTWITRVWYVSYILCIGVPFRIVHVLNQTTITCHRKLHSHEWCFEATWVLLVVISRRPSDILIDWICMHQTLT